jgi:hypothetical protein
MRDSAGATGTPCYEILALKYAGPFTSSVAKVLLDTDWEKTIERNYYSGSSERNEPSS